MFYTNEQLEEAIKKSFEYYFFCKKPFKPQDTLIGIIGANTNEGYLHHFPLSVFWKITSNCNLRCKHCFYYSNQLEFDSSEDFTSNDLYAIADFFINELNIINFTITGGEPLLQSEVLGLLKYLKERNVTIQLQTNGTLLTEEIAKTLSYIFDENDSVQVSIDGITEDTNDKIRGLGSYKKAIAGIKMLTASSVNTIISYTITAENILETPNLYELCKNLNVKQVNMGRFRVCSPEQEYLKPELDQIFIVFSELIKKIKKEDGLHLNAMFLKTYDFLNYEIGKKLLDEYLSNKKIRKPENLMCHKHDKFNLCADGRMYLCADTESEDLCLGNLKHQSFYEIWANRYNNVFFQPRERKNSVCSECKYISLCKAGCPAKAYSKYCNINAQGGDCPIKLQNNFVGKKEDANCVK
jgi:radical SAM protein with 4Fe4S-binding SPASM domain